MQVSVIAGNKKNIISFSLKPLNWGQLRIIKREILYDPLVEFNGTFLCEQIKPQSNT